MGFPLPLPEGCRDCGKRKLGRTQPDRALRQSQRPSRSSARRARHARRKEAAARGSARLRASLDGRCDWRSVRVQAGAEKRRSNRTEKLKIKAGRDGEIVTAAEHQIS
jgi:predicted  nucleic acid-binding Zn-ribbon protein